MTIRFLTVLSCLVLLSGPVWAAPKLVVEDPEFDFGSVHQGAKVSHSFVFSNGGDDTLVIDKFRSSCGCTAALLSSKRLKPGEQGELKTTFDSARFRGEVIKKIYLYSNDPQAPVRTLQVRGEVLELFSLSPRQVNFGPVKSGRTVERRIILTNHTDEELRIDAARTTTPQLKTRFEKTLPAGTSREILVSLNMKPGQKRFSGYVLFDVLGAKSYELRLPVYATVQ